MLSKENVKTIIYVFVSKTFNKPLIQDVKMGNILDYDAFGQFIIKFLTIPEN